MKISDGTNEVDLSESGIITLRSLNSLLSIKIAEDDPIYGNNILFSLNDERIYHNQLAGLAEDDHKQYLDQARHLALHSGDLGQVATVSLDSLLDVNIVNPKYPEVLKFNGTDWSNARITHHELIGPDTYDDHPQYFNLDRHNLLSHSYYNVNTGTGNLPHDKLKNLTDVDVELMKNGQVLVKSGDKFIPADFPVFDTTHNHDEDYLRLDGTSTPTSNISMGNRRIINLARPVNPNDAATKGLVDEIVWRKPVIAITNAYPANPVNGNRYAISHTAVDDSIRGQIIEYQNGWVITPAYYGNAFFNIQDKKPYYWNGTIFNTFGNTIPVEDIVLRNGSTPLTGNWNTGDYTIRTPNAVQFDDVANKLDVYARFAQMTFSNPVIDIQLPNHDVGYPANPKVGDRYVASWASIPGSTPQAIFECYEITIEGAKWIVATRKKGMVVFSIYHDAYFWYDGNVWERFEKSFDIREMNYGDLHLDHGSLDGLAHDDHLIYIPTDGSRPLTGNLNADGYRLQNLHDGTADTDAVTYRQLMLVSSGINWIEPVDLISNTPDTSKKILVGTSPTGAFVGHTNEIATYSGSWSFYTPVKGDACLIKSIGDQVQYDGTKWITIFNGTTHSNLIDAPSATNHNRYLRNDADGTETGLVTFDPAGRTWPFEVGTTQTGRVARLNADKVDSKDVMDSALIPQADRLVVTDANGNIHANKVYSDGVRVNDGVDYTELTTDIATDETTFFITLNDLTTRIIRSNAQKMFLGESEVLTTENISTADVDMVDGKHASDFAPVVHTHLDEIALNDLKDVDAVDPEDNYVLTYDLLNAIWRAKKFNEITTLAHASLAQLYTDDHLQYVHTQNARSISAQHSFTNDNAPFLVTSQLLVENLNANYLQGLTKDDFALVEHSHNLIDLDDVSATDIANGDILSYKDGEFIPIPLWAIPPDERYMLKPTTDQAYSVLFSDGAGGVVVNDIKTNDYQQLDMGQHQLKSAVIDCGAYYG